MVRLVDEYRPRRLDRMVGQEAARAVLAHHIRSGGPGVFLLEGPYGCGKTSLAAIAASALLCEKREPLTFSEPCGRVAPCDGCRQVETTLATQIYRSPLFEYHDCGRDKTVGSIRLIANQARTPPDLFGPRRAIVLDEVHNLERAGFEALLEILGTPPDWLTVFLLTTEPDRIPDAIHSRCTPLAIDLVPDALARRHAVWICDEEKIAYEDAAIDLLVGHAAGHVRDLVKAIDLVAQTGAVDVAQVQRLIKLGRTTILLDYLEALTSGAPLSAQVGILKGWTTEPGLKAEALQRLLWFLYMNDVRRQHVEDRTLIELTQAKRHALVTAFNALARAGGHSPRAFWEDLISFWTLAAGAVNEGVLRERLMRFDARINPPVPIPASPPARARTPPHRAPREAPGVPVRARGYAPARDDPDGDSEAGGRHLPRAHARRVFDAGSFMARHHGCWFNARASFRHADLGLTDHGAAADLVGRFVHELRLGLRRWGPAGTEGGGADAALHWICLHENPAGRGLVSTVIAHVPARHHRDVQAWFGGPFLHGKRLAGRADAVRLKLSPLVATGPDDRRPSWLHAHLMRLLCRGLDPALRARARDGSRRPLIDLLGVRPCLRRPAGDVALRQAYSTSDAISRAAQALERARGFEHLSAFGAGAWHRLDDAWEAHEHADRRRWSQEAERRRTEADIVSRVGLNGGPHAQHLVDRHSVLNYDPAHMLRSWDVW